MKVSNNQKGFSAVEALIIIVIVGLLSFGGWYVWQNQRNSAASNTTNQPSKDLVVNNKELDRQKNNLMAGWLDYSSSQEAGFSLRYPQTWVKAEGQEACTTTNTMGFGADAGSRGICSAGARSQIFILSAAGDSRSDRELSSKKFSNIETQEVTINGTLGKRQNGNYIRTQDDDEYGPAEPRTENGSKRVIYLFYANKRTYFIEYTQGTSSKDILEEFDLMVTKTFKFSAT